jgi:GH15 family glucan-1,4-alpha-glucosidase
MTEAAIADHGGAQISNLPQAFTHLARVDAAITLDQALDRAAPR